jgi:serine/threonine-protein kinase
LAKELDDRYQNAKDFATDLRACRDTLPRTVQPIDIQRGDKLAGVVVNDRHQDTDPLETAVATLGLSSVFDSNEATMRLAALTTSSEDMDELSKTLKLKSHAAPVKTSRPVSQASPAAGGSFKLLVLLLTVLVLIVLIYTKR